MSRLKLHGILIAVIAMLISSTTVLAQNSTKELKKNLRSRVEKDSRKTAKKLEKEDWTVMPGKLPMERQIQDGRYAELDTNEEGAKLYFTATHQSIGGNYSAAKKIASSRALAELAEQVETKVSSIVENNVSNINFGDGDLETIDKCISASKQTVAAKLSGAILVLDIYREQGDHYESMVMYKLNAQNAIKVVREIYKEELRKESTLLSEKLDKALGEM